VVVCQLHSVARSMPLHYD